MDLGKKKPCVGFDSVLALEAKRLALARARLRRHVLGAVKAQEEIDRLRSAGRHADS